MGSSPTTSQQLEKTKDKDSLLPHKHAFRIEQLPVDEKDRATIGRIMKTHSLLSTLTDKQRSECLPYFQKWVYSCGRYIYRQHDIPSNMFLIGSGSVSVEIDCSIVKSMGEGEYFGHDTVCFDSPRSESIRVITGEITVFSIGKEQVMPVVQSRMQDYKEDINCMFNRIHFFNYLTNKERKFLIDSTQLFQLNPSETLFEKEQDANSFYVVRRNTVLIQIDSKKDIVMKEGDYFGESAFLQLLNNSNKSQRMGKALADKEGAEVYAIGLSPVKVCLGYYIRSIIFFNQEKWALYRNEFINSLPHVDFNYLLQLFNVKEGKKYSILAKKGTRPKYIFIPLEVEINKSRELKIYCSELIDKQNEDQVITYDVILTDNGYYAYALIDELRQVLALNKSTYSNEIEIKLLKQPLYMNLTLTLRNLSKFSKKLASSDYTIVLIVQDMKFGNEFIVKIYKKKIKNNPISNHCLHEPAEHNRLKSYKVISHSNELTANIRQGLLKNKTSLKMIYGNHCENVESGKVLLEEEMIRREKELISSLCNNYICGYYKAQEDENNYYLFFEYIIGSKLEDIIGSFGKVPYKVAKYFLASIADALHYLHAQHILYRNLNPNDIIVKNNGKLVLIDFSCAKRLDPTHRTSTLIGTPFYMAPEVIQESSYSYSADIWSMGVIFYEMVTGVLPFGATETDPISIYEAVISKELDLKIIQGKNERLLLSSLLLKNPAERMQHPLEIRNFAYIDDLQFEWEEFLKERLSPPYYPPLTKLAFANINNYEIFDASSVVDWN
jgi:serine/threonine protein kinase/CRP-like cAMP-binding protein